MANCFGEIVDDSKLDGMVRYVGKRKKQEDRAREAMNLMNEDNKNTKASTYVDSVKSWYGDGESTLCLLYNATGETLQYVAAHDWFGYIGRTPYPHDIGNGQWAAFHHVHMTGDASGSEAAIVYRGKNKDGQDKDFLLAWSTPWSNLSKNKAYCAINEVDYFQSRWDSINDSLNNSGYTSKVTDAGSSNIEASTAAGDTPKFTALITIPYAL